MVKRYGPFVAVAAVGVAAFVVFGGGGDDDPAEDPDGELVDTRAEGDELILSGPMTPARAELEGEDPDFGSSCDLETGRLAMPTVYAPPCVVPFEGDNGGAISAGVSEDTIRVVNYVIDIEVDPIYAGFVGAAGQEMDLDRQAETIQGYVDLYSALFETYGRQVEVETFTGTGTLDDVAAAQADAISIAEREPFAVVGGPADPTASEAFARELAARGVLCLRGCVSGGQTMPFFEENAPFVHFDGTPEPGMELAAEMVGKLAGPGPAELAGDPELRDQERVYASVRQDNQGADAEVVEALEAALGEWGIELAVDIDYSPDVTRAQETARTVITRLKDAGVTTIIYQGNPILPGSFTEEATAQDYYPEWILGPAGFVDSPRFARGYDPEQWPNGFGLTPETAPAAPELGLQTRLWNWAYGGEPPSGNFAGFLEPPLRALFVGVHLAGPELTPETFDEGLRRYPASGGTPLAPLYTPHYTESGDIAIIQWDPGADGIDPDGTDNVGFYRFTNGGERYQPGEIPDTPEAAGLFDEQSSVVQYTEIPPEYRLPDYQP